MTTVGELHPFPDGGNPERLTATFAEWNGYAAATNAATATAQTRGHIPLPIDYNWAAINAHSANEASMVFLAHTNNNDYHRWAFTPTGTDLELLQTTLTAVLGSPSEPTPSHGPSTLLGPWNLEHSSLISYRGFQLLHPYRPDVPLADTYATAGALDAARDTWPALHVYGSAVWIRPNITPLQGLPTVSMAPAEAPNLLARGPDLTMEKLLIRLSGECGFHDVLRDQLQFDERPR